MAEAAVLLMISQLLVGNWQRGIFLRGEGRLISTITHVLAQARVMVTTTTTWPRQLLEGFVLAYNSGGIRVCEDWDSVAVDSRHGG